MRPLRIAAGETTRAVRVVGARRGGGAVLVAVMVVALPASGALGQLRGEARRATHFETPAAPPSGRTGDDHAFLVRRADGSPYTFVCAGPVEVRLNPEGAPYDAEQDLRVATERLAAGLGMAVVYGGLTDDDPSSFRRRSHPVPSILVSWVATADGLEDPHTDGTVGMGGPIVVGEGIVGGRVSLVAESGLSPGAGPGGYVGVMMHEFAHAANLGHSADPRDQLYPRVVPGRSAGWGPGDVAGLHRLGASCSGSGTEAA